MKKLLVLASLVLSMSVLSQENDQNGPGNNGVEDGFKHTTYFSCDLGETSIGGKVVHINNGSEGTYVELEKVGIEHKGKRIELSFYEGNDDLREYIISNRADEEELNTGRLIKFNKEVGKKNPASGMLLIEDNVDGDYSSAKATLVMSGAINVKKIDMDCAASSNWIFGQNLR